MEASQDQTAEKIGLWLWNAFLILNVLSVIVYLVKADVPPEFTFSIADNLDAPQ